MESDRAALQVATFPTELGWMAVIGSASLLKQLTFGHSSRSQALLALDPELLTLAHGSVWCEELIGRLQAYAAGTSVDFADVRIDLAGRTTFQQKVIARCREIPAGQTRSYAQLAAAAGSPGAARAVGSIMAKNRFPLIVPCHRVVSSAGVLGGFSAPQGARMKARLLRLERSTFLATPALELA